MVLPSGNSFASGSEDSTVRVWTRGGSNCASTSASATASSPIDASTWVCQAKLTTTGLQCNALNVRNLHVLCRMQSCLVSPLGTFLRVWGLPQELEDGRVKSVACQETKHISNITSVALLSDGTIASGSMDRTVYMYKRTNANEGAAKPKWQSAGTLGP